VSAGQTTEFSTSHGFLEGRAVFFRAKTATRVANLARLILWLLSLLFAGGFYFFVELLDDCLAIGEWRDNFTLDSLFLFARRRHHRGHRV
jgi:hypothetical protein